MTFPKLGRLETLTARSVWQLEAQTFTPWLAENLDILAEALQVGELTLRSTEVPAGEFRLDILAEDSAGDPVLIENQFGNTDHKHLGQLITYIASQRGNATAIWIAESIRDDHRAAIDWLNATTAEGIDFFGVEVEALRIGDSDPAPFFRVVAKPNAWTREVDVQVQHEDAERHTIRIAYWAAFAEYLRQHDPSFVIRRQVRDHWHEFRIGRSGFVISATISIQKHRIGVELYIHNDPTKAYIHALQREQTDIEREVGATLNWQELQGKKGSRVALFLPNVDPSDQSAYPHLHQWMLAQMQAFRRAFASRIRALPNAGAADEEADRSE